MNRFAATPFAILLALSLLLTAGTGGAQTTAQRMSPETARANYVAAFGSYVEWPASAFADAEAPFVIGVMDDEVTLRLLEAGFKTRRLQGRAVQVRRVDNILQAIHVHLLYTPEGNAAPLRPLNGLPILTIGSGTGFLDRGGIIGLLMREEQLRFELNAKAAERSGLKVSAKLQQLALRTYEESR
ncbi:YfiR family protein [Paucibacter sp. B2R-40]|uniref:YfiR family protein n=1 Tax=Paucibacter sp. B2R-40 TaxID=2893554 RepID=UPI0021E3FB7B|nr:YfiR family protein [Paucibacter sp. B2R-40]MCV2354421.1 YfiR family protein [Paucibacter sp. B2R-40]